MNISTIGILLCMVSFCNADILRICEVANAPSDKFERMPLAIGKVTEVVFVSKNVIVGDGDVLRAAPVPDTVDQIDVQLTETGAKKLQAVTDKLVYGRDRLALIVDGRLASNPVVLAPLGSSLRIAGLKDLDADGLADLARRIAGGSSSTKNEKEALSVPATSKKEVEAVPPNGP